MLHLGAPVLTQVVLDRCASALDCGFGSNWAACVIVAVFDNGFGEATVAWIASVCGVPVVTAPIVHDTDENKAKLRSRPPRQEGAGCRD
jgi:hypothetical protein